MWQCNNAAQSETCEPAANSKSCALQDAGAKPLLWWPLPEHKISVWPLSHCQEKTGGWGRGRPWGARAAATTFSGNRQQPAAAIPVAELIPAKGKQARPVFFFFGRKKGREPGNTIFNHLFFLFFRTGKNILLNILWKPSHFEFRRNKSHIKISLNQSKKMIVLNNALAFLTGRLGEKPY